MSLLRLWMHLIKKKAEANLLWITFTCDAKTKRVGSTPERSKIPRGLGTVVSIPLCTAKRYLPLQVMVNEGGSLYAMELKISPKDRHSHSQRFSSKRTSKLNPKTWRTVKKWSQVSSWWHFMWSCLGKPPVKTSAYRARVTMYIYKVSVNTCLERKENCIPEF